MENKIQFGWLLVEPNSVVRTVEFAGSVKSVPQFHNKGPEFKSSFYFAFFLLFLFDKSESYSRI